MRFKEFLNEMTAVLSDMSFPMESYRKHIEKKILSDGKKIGEIETKNLYYIKLDGYDLFGLYENSLLVSLVTGERLTIKSFGRVFEINGMVTHKDYQGQALTTKIFLYLKTRKKWKILIGNVISKANRKNLEKLNTNTNFELKWLNIKTGEVTKFIDSDNFNENGRATNWQVLIENTKDLEIICESKKFNKTYTDINLYDYMLFNQLTNEI